MPISPAHALGTPLCLADDASRSIGDQLAARVARCPDGLVRTYGNDGVRRSITYVKAWARSARIAASLAAEGVEPGRPIVVAIRDAVDFVPAFLACLRAGHVVVALHSAIEAARHPRDELALRTLLRKLGDPLLLVDKRFMSSAVAGALLRDHRALPLSATIEAAANWDDTAVRPSPTCLVATSGSTGSLKLATLEAQALRHRYFSQGIPAPHAGVHSLVLFPTDSITGLQTAFLMSETFTQIAQEALATRPGVILEAIHALGITKVSMTNSMAMQLLQADPSIDPEIKVGTLTGVGLGGETVSRDIAARLDAMLARRGAPNVVWAGYGATEVGTIVAGANPLDAAPGREQSVPLGGCASGVAMRIVGEDGALLEEGTVGEVEIHTPLKVFSGYWDEPQLSQSAFTPDGWWKTGDLGQLDAGVFTFRGRSKQVLVVHGRKLSLAEIDAQLQAHPDIGVPIYSCALRSPGEATERLGIAFVARKGETADEIAETIRSLTLRRFGIRPDPVVAVPRSRLPLTATGKLRRAELAELVIAQRRGAIRQEGVSAQLEARPQCHEIEAALDAIWREVLDLGAGFDRTASFFECGGDSLRSAALYACIEAKLDHQLDMPAFFAEPTFANLIRLVDRTERFGQDGAQRPDEVEAWPLPTAFRQRQLAFLETWPGQRVTRDRLLTGLNTSGPLPPLFCVFQAADEFSELAAALGDQQPIYGFRSAIRVARYTEDIVQSIALRYVHNLEQVRPTGPIFLLGQCQGAIIAIAMAQHLLRRGRHIPLLVLAKWATTPAYYPGPTLLLCSRDNVFNPKPLGGDPIGAWRRMFPDFVHVDILGNKNDRTLYAQENVHALAQELRKRFDTALAQPPRFLPKGACRIDIKIDALPERLAAGQLARFALSVRNVGDIVISARTTGLFLGNYWIREDATGCHPDACVAMPDLAPGASHQVTIPVCAPMEPDRYRLCIDLMEEGYRWLNPIGQCGFSVGIEIERTAQVKKVQSFVKFDYQNLLYKLRQIVSILHGTTRGSS